MFCNSLRYFIAVEHNWMSIYSNWERLLWWEKSLIYDQKRARCEVSTVAQFSKSILTTNELSKWMIIVFFFSLLKQFFFVQTLVAALQVNRCINSHETIPSTNFVKNLERSWTLLLILIDFLAPASSRIRWRWWWWRCSRTMPCVGFPTGGEWRWVWG